MRLAKRLDLLPPYLFVEISRKIAEKRARGEKVVSLAIGDPDIPTPQHIIDHLFGTGMEDLADLVDSISEELYESKVKAVYLDKVGDGTTVGAY
ncbi:MAG: hypothetical protein QGH66_02880, partial [Dehalococcoidia bacterium]|nr:hypothetical protein [Dehalococcoidia bacterium]